MLHIFKLNGHRVAYDTHAHKVYPLSALALKMIDALTPPLAEDCPSALRYAFAKYDSHDLAEAYAELYALYKNGLLFAEDGDSSAEITANTTVITTSAPAAFSKIETAISSGAKNLHVYIKDATTCLASSLHEAFDGKVKIRLILDLTPATLTDEDIRALNNAGDVLWITTSASVSEPVQSAWDSGISAVYAEIPDTDGTRKDLARLAKVIESAAEEGIQKEFFPFTEALTSLRPFCGTSAACTDCWARLLCGGRKLDVNGTQTPACETQRTVTECAIILTDGV